MDNELKQIIQSELNYTTEFSIQSQLDYYLGNPRGDEQPGRSSVISTDVADSIEWLMPQIMKAFTESNEVVMFDPEHEGDEQQAALETEFVYDTLMKKSGGFVAIHAAVKDALLHNNGVLKIYYDDYYDSKTSEYSGITRDQLSILASSPDTELLALDDNSYIDEIGQQVEQFSVRVKCSKRNPKICIVPVPIEQFRVNSDHNSIDLNDARFTAHIVRKTISDLRKLGIDEEVISTIPDTSYIDSDVRFSAQGETSFINHVTSDKTLRQVDIGECYMMHDHDQDGIAERVKVLCVISNHSVSTILSVEPIDDYPWVATTAILMGHKFRGMSMYDRIKPLQDQKTSLLRNILDNIYFINNRMIKYREGSVDPNELLISRPRGLIPVTNMDDVMEMDHMPLGQDAYQLLEYIDQMRAGRTGVSAEGSTAPQNIGTNIGSQGVDRLMTAKEELVGLIIRVVAETLVKPLCIKIRDLMVQHFDVVQDYKFRGQWLQVSPAQWPPRSTCSVRVGTGSGDQQKQLAAINQVIAMQQQLAALPQAAALLDPQKSFDTLDDLCKFSGLSGANRYFVDPSSPQGQQAMQAQGEQQQALQAKQEQIEQLQLQMQMQMAESTVTTSKAEVGMVQAKSEADRAKAMLQEEKQSYEARIKALEQELAQARHNADLAYKYDELAVKTSLELKKMNQQALENLQKVDAEIEQSKAIDKDSE
jgi:hypothetical protein